MFMGVCTTTLRLMNIVEAMSRGLVGLRGYQRGGPVSLGGGLAALLSRKFGRGARRLAPLFFGERSEMPPYIPESIYNAVTPWASGSLDADVLSDLMDAMGRIARGDPGSPRAAYSPHMGDANRLAGENSYRKQFTESRPTDEEDAWRIFLDLPQQHGTFKESEFRPTIGSGEDTRYMEFADPKRVWNEIRDSREYRRYDELNAPVGRGAHIPHAIQTLLKEIEDPSLRNRRYRTPGSAFRSKDRSDDPHHRYSDVLGTYTVDKGEDERGPYISYYDKYDLKHLPARITNVGQPFDVYGRMYYDPETYEYRGSNE